jgi:hypothetical protein
MDVSSVSNYGLYALQKTDEQKSFELTEEEKKEVEELKKKDAEVKGHEQAHVAAASGIKTSGPHYQWTTPKQQ